ncbi:MAG: hypothetical protein ACJ8FY_16420 [Gemmataceae bacterium]
MATAPQAPKFVQPAGHDVIRIVPLHVPGGVVAPLAGVAAPPGPRLSYRGGPLMTAVEVFTLFWGDAWQTTQAGLAATINKFFDAILTSSLLDQLAEYNVAGQAIGHGKRTGTATAPAAHMPHSVSDNAVRHFIQQEIASNPAVPQPSKNTLYFTYLPPGVALVQGGGKSCQAFCGYHDAINGQIFYAAMPYPGCAGCTGGLAVADAITSTSSHELCEAITDPIPGQGWYDDVHGEIGDICAWKSKKVGHFTVQLEWSNKANACV